jgi:thioredoxin 1
VKPRYRFKRPLLILILYFLSLNPCHLYSAQGQTHKTIEELYPGLASEALLWATPAKMNRGTLLSSGKLIIKESEVVRVINQSAPAIRPQLAKNAFYVLEKIAAKRLLLPEALAKGKKKHGTSEEILSSYLNQKFKDQTISEEEISQYYRENKHLIGDPDQDPLKESLRDFLKEQKKQKSIRRYIMTLGQRRPIRVNADWIEEQDPIVKDNPIDRLRKAGKSSLVLFGALGECSCDMVSPILIALGQKYKDRIEVLIISLREERVLAERFGVQTIPDIIVFDRQGREIFRHVGFLPERAIEEKLKVFGLI